MKQYEMFELVFQGSEPEGSHVSVNLEVTFEVLLPDGTAERQEVKGFYAGNDTYKVRFYPKRAGTYSWKTDTELSLTGPVNGEEICTQAAADGHGMVKAAGTHFEYEDGSYYYPFGTTIYALPHQERQLIHTTIETLAHESFNKVRFCVFPKHYDYNNNEPEFYPFEKDAKGNWDVDRPCFVYWEHLEEIIRQLSMLGIQSDLILFHPYDNWGFSSMTQEQNLIYLDYLIRRLGAMPDIWWSLANEFDLCFHKTMDDWYEMEQFVWENDPYGHLLSNHNCFSFYDFHREHITHCSMQSNQMIRATQWLKDYGKPIIYDECCYEGDLPQNWGNISGFELANRFWIACAQGAYATHGEVFLSDDEVLWWAKGGRLKGKSPERIAFLRKIIEELGAPLEPWEVNPMEGFDEEMIRQILDIPVAKLPEQMPLDQQEAHLFTDAAFRGHIGERVFIQYLGIHCNSVLDWHLPENKSYKIEVIDIWEMTREEAMYGASGRFRIELPGKEGIAVLATQE